MKITSSDQWEPSDNIKLEKAADESVRTMSNVLVVAGPGAGKTELLAQKARFLFSTNLCRYPRKILAISFKNDAADNLKKRVIRRSSNEFGSRFTSLTYDAFAKSILDRFRLSLPKGNVPRADYLVNDDKIIEEAFKEAGYVSPCGTSPSTKKRFYEMTITSVKLPLQGDDLGVKIWEKLLEGFGENSACLSFKMILMLAIYIIQSNQKLRRALQMTYSHVFLDEFQDTTNLQYDLVKACFLGSDCGLTAVGDNKQRIMLWAGAQKTVFKDFIDDFYAEEKHLVMNHRSAPRLVNLQKAMYDSLNDTSGNVEASDKWSPDEGIISLLITRDNAIEEEWLATDIQKIITGGTAPNDICILCKQLPQDYTSGLISKLAGNNIQARIETEYQDLLKEPIVVLVLSLLKLVINRKHPSEWEFLLEETSRLKGIEQDISQNYSFCKMQEDISAFIERCTVSLLKINSFELLSALVHEVIDYFGENRIKACYIAYGQGRYLEDRINKFIELLWNELSVAKFNWENAIESFEGANSIPIMTIHKSKGLEYSNVYFVGLEDSAFWNFKNQPEEDRCAFFVALSRAKQRVTFTYCDYRNGMKFPQQKRDQINEFFSLLQSPGMANVIRE